MASYAFEPDSHGMELFKQYLQSSPPVSSRLLIDIIEEDFNKDTIPHVNSSDRKAIIKRTIDRKYRQDHRFTNHKVIGRKTTGRKDDIILYSVLSHSSMLDPWLDVIFDTETSLEGIWSVPYLTKDIYKHLNTSHSNILIVSQQVPSNLRQTFIKNGQFESSRLAVVNLDEETIGNYIEGETEQTIRFLSNNRHIGFDEIIEIHIFCNMNDLAEIKTHCQDTPRRHYQYHTIDDLHNKLDIKTEDNQYCNSIFTYFCSKSFLPPGHYYDRKLLHHYLHNMISIGLYTTGVIILAISILFSFSLYSDSTNLQLETALLSDQQRALKNQHTKLTDGFTDKIKIAKTARSTVLVADKIQALNKINPHSLLSIISKKLSPSDLRNITITRFSWSRHQHTNLNSSRIKSGTSNSNFLTDEEIQQKVVIGGHFNTQNQPVRNIVSQTSSLISSLQSIPGILSVTLINAPLDIDPKSRVTHQHGYQTNLSTINNESSTFEIELFVRGDI